MNSDQVFIDERFHQDEEAKAQIKKFADYSAGQLTEIITKYISYEPESVRAALYLAVEKGLISYDLKEQLRDQIESNFKTHKNHIKSYSWEKNNAFVKFVSAYTDDQLYDIIENPGDIVIDVYFAVLAVARERELISEVDFLTYCQDAKSGTVTENDTDFIYTGSHSPSYGPEDELTEEELKAEKEKLWKCPKCNQLVGMELAVCWNCGEEAPSVIEHPGNTEIIKELKEAEPSSTRKLFRSGFILIVLGIAIALFEHYRTYYSSIAQHMRPFSVGFGIITAVIGLIVLLIAIFLFFNKDAD